jgi:hypothetical protein
LNVETDKIEGGEAAAIDAVCLGTGLCNPDEEAGEAGPLFDGGLATTIDKDAGTGPLCTEGAIIVWLMVPCND